ncbi:BREX-1 system phosphatase PglZ type B [Halomonas sp.]|uniref:BREX-1 system phosphatase PglZ type B n=1 Tax=Halomonas sp. TaxID=1486246 RepID=UPI00298E27E3|nr:BREX-1 system phosphatase PglZ type B [Halomonas sp.]MDW7745487.1 BREX-1 system phosphatase PglZ type B [Halomonas sp.]
MMLLDQLVQYLRSTAAHNPDVQVAPACILWPDRERLWEPVIAQIQTVLPELLVLGDYAPGQRRGPAIWLRCAIAGTVEGVEWEDETPPILYLPGVGRQDLRAVSECPDALKPLAELQYRGVLWSQVNAKDWTPRAFLSSQQGGLGLEIAGDSATRQALLAALPRLLQEEIADLQGRHLDAEAFNTLLSGGDPVRDLLDWLNQPEAMKASWPSHEWQAFCQVCHSRYGLHPDRNSPLEAAERLIQRQGNWKTVWARFTEAPHRYLQLIEQIRQLTPPALDFFPEPEQMEVWPQLNQREEERLYHSLCELGSQPAHQARERLEALEGEHGIRRDYVWAQLGESPLAMAMAPLAELARVTQHSLAGGQAEDMRQAYASEGWKADDALLRALNEVSGQREQEAIFTAARTVYLHWADEAASHLQQVWQPGVDGLKRGEASPNSRPGECVLFVDGLRLDCGKRLARRLTNQGLEVAEHSTWAALPSVTGTGKYAVAPILGSSAIQEEPDGYEFTPITRHLFKKLLRDNGWQVLERRQVEQLHKETLDTSRPAWCEFGDIDHAGHERGWKLAQHVDDMLAEVAERIQALLAQGWSQVRVVTDHGWLLLPGELPKTELPASLVETKWGRCAALKPGAHTDAARFPWYWNEQVHFALAKSIYCFKAGETYTHGGLSLQECVTPELVVTGSAGPKPSVLIDDLVWKGLRCTLVVEGSSDGLTLDVRRHAGDPASSLVLSPKPFKTGGKASVVVEDDDLEGDTAYAVVLDSGGQVLAQRSTTIGSSE